MAVGLAVAAVLALVGQSAAGICPRLRSPDQALGLSNIKIDITVSFDLVVTPNEVVSNSSYAGVRYVVEDVGDNPNVLVEGIVDLAGIDEALDLKLYRRTFPISIPGLTSGGHDLMLRMTGLPQECYTQGKTQEEGVPFRVEVIPAMLSLLPPVSTIFFTIISRNAVVSLTGGVWIGATLVNGYNPITGWLRLLDTYVVNSMASSGNASIILIMLFITGMVGVLSKSGGAAGVAKLVLQYATTAERGLIATWCTGLCIFFSDSANILVNGNAFRPIAEQLRISRAKLAFVVDCVGACICSIAPFSTWVSYEVGLIGDELGAIAAREGASGGQYIETDAYVMFLKSVPHSFYQLMALAFALMVAASGRDIGPMVAVEAAVRGGKVEDVEENEEAIKEREQDAPKPGVPIRALNGFIPILSMVFTLLVGLFGTGISRTLDQGQPLGFLTVLGNASSYNALLYGSMMGLIMPMIALKVQQIMEPLETLSVWFEGMKTLIEPLFILLGAWSLGQVVRELGLPAYVIQVLGPSVHIGAVPTIAFLISCVISFSTGTSWGTMAIMFPLVIPLMWTLSGVEDLGLDLAGREDRMVQGIGAILGGAVFGDHCSPISDTTILSAIATGCKPIDHVKTQMPYAAIAAGVAIVLGYLMTGMLGPPVIVSVVAGWATLWGILQVFGTPAQPLSASVELEESLAKA